MLTLRGATFSYAGAPSPSLRDVDLDLAGGEVLGIVGPSDAGKSTLCLVLGGLAPRVTRGTLRGTLTLDGEDVAGRPMATLVGEVASGFQDPYGQLSMVADTVYEEVAFGPANLGLPREELIDRVEGALARLRLGDLAARDPRRLSGGQQQLVAIAGLLAMRPRHLILDEPTAHLDAHGTGLVLDAIATLAAEGVAILLVEQDTSVLESACTRVAALDRGRVAAEGAAAEVLSDPTVLALGVEEPAGPRLERLVRQASHGAATMPTDT